MDELGSLIGIVTLSHVIVWFFKFNKTPQALKQNAPNDEIILSFFTKDMQVPSDYPIFR